MRKFIMTIVSLLFVAGCSTTIKVEEFDTEGNKIVTKYSESAYIAKMNSATMMNLGVVANPCDVVYPDEFAKLSASGQEAFGRAAEMCQIRMMVAGAMGTPSTAQGQIALQNAKAIAAIEQSEAQKTSSWLRAGLGIGGFYFGYKTIDAIASAGGDTITVDGVQQSNSINGSTIGGLSEGELNEHGIPTTSGDRSNVFNIKSNTFTQSKSTSSAFSATGAGDKPTAQEGPATGNNTLNDNDDVQGELGIIP